MGVHKPGIFTLRHTGSILPDNGSGDRRTQRCAWGGQDLVSRGVGHRSSWPVSQGLRPTQGDEIQEHAEPVAQAIGVCGLCLPGDAVFSTLCFSGDAQHFPHTRIGSERMRSRVVKSSSPARCGCTASAMDTRAGGCRSCSSCRIWFLFAFRSFSLPPFFSSSALRSSRVTGLLRYYGLC